MGTRSIYKSIEGREAILSLYDGVLERWPVEKEVRSVPTRYGETFVITSGKAGAPDLVLLHGSASNATSWIGDVAEYSSHFRVHAIDLPGEPGRSAENRPSWQTDDFAVWLEQVFDELGISTAAVLGLSQGGWTAIRFAVSHPERVSRLVIIAPSGIVPTKTTFLLKAIFYSLMGKAGARRTNALVMGEQELHEDAVNIMNTIMTHFNARVEKEYIFSDEELSRLVMPVLLIGGADDVIQDAGKSSDRLGSVVENLESRVIENMGHCLVNQAPAVIPFLTR